jgi:shikimate dehydrogenase
MQHKLFALIGYPLNHSFSKAFFEQKFVAEKIENVLYKIFPIECIDLLPTLLDKETDLYGFNVTIPYKEAIILFLDKISNIAKEVGAVNVVKIERNKNGKQYLIGHNTDVYGFEKTLCNSVPSLCFSVKQKEKITQSYTENTRSAIEKSALIFGTGGAAKAVSYVFKKLNIDYQFVSRNPKNNTLTYKILTKKIIEDNLLLINTTPLGMFPNVDVCPPIDYTAISEKHFLFDLIYNPEETLFMKKGKEYGAFVQNGYEMLCYQAEEAWKIWNKK